jgi:uncharacterized protein YndB with AHSA1/START domain
MHYTYTLTTTIPASAADIYEAWLDSHGHSQMTGAPATMSDEPGAEVSAWDGYISGRNLELVPDEKIVQSWRTTEFTDDHEDSVITVMLEEVAGGTLLTLVHTKVPEAQRSYEESGWETHYFEPMKEYFAKRSGAKVKAAPKAKTKTKTKTKTKSKAKAKARSKAKAKPAASKAKTAARNRKKSKAAAKAKKSANKTKRKAAKGKRRK